VKYIPIILGFVLPYWKLATVSVFLILATGLASLLAPWPLAILVDNVLGGHPLPSVLAGLLGPQGESPRSLLLIVIAAGLFVALLGNGLTVLDNYVNTKLEQRMSLDLRSGLFQHAQRLSIAYHDQRRSGRLIYMINSQASAVPGLVMAVPPLAQSLITLIGMFLVLLRLDVQLALLSVTVTPFLFYSVRYYLKHIQERLLKVRGMEAESLSIIHEAISMIRVIVAFGREGFEYRRFREQGEQAIDERVKVTVRQTLFSLAVNMTTATGTALVLGVGAYHALQGRLQVGQLLVAMAYIASVYKPLESITYTVGTLQDKLISLRVATDLLDTVPDIKDLPGAVEVRRATGAVVLQGVSFSHQGRTDTLKDVSFEAKAGRMVAIVGPTGAGKTTLISLIPRFYDPSRGRILLDGHDTRTLTLRSLREQISLVSQEPLLFSGAIADNIRYGRLDASMDEVIEAAQSANAHDFIMRLPKQYDTELGERGAKLSGGERQRICIARAFLKDAPILILDEPTSSIDSKTEAVILDAIDRLVVGRTTLLIAHRLSTVRGADVILVMDHGQLVERGTHAELLESGGLYKQLHDLQSVHGRLRPQPA
jgi:ATP-binding cassette subfamily B protein/subfamily B ATP-binding cassette protein MsbA